MLGTISGEQQRLSTRSNIHVGTFHAAKQQLTNRHAKHGTAWLARDHAFAPLRLNIRTQPFDLRGFADTVDAFKGDEYALHIHHCTLRRSQRYRCSLLRTAHRHRSCDARQLSLLAATYSPQDRTSKEMNMPCIFITGRELRRDGHILRWRQAIPHRPSPWSAWNRSPWRYGCWPNPYRPTRAPWHGDRHELDQQKP